MAKIKEEIQINETLLLKMREIYQEYTGDQIAAVIGKIRKEIEAERELNGILADIDRLEARREVLANIILK